jgi:hypothetical protein
VYSTCLFCHRPLGANDLIERFPIGRRLAFDAAKGRLWVICPACSRWNLTPLEERWEAVEDLERRVRATRFRVSTDNIGLARLPGGLDAVRIGKPLRPEMAGWRYGRVITGRYWRRGVPAAVATGVGMASAVAGMLHLVPLAAVLGTGVVAVVSQIITNRGGISGNVRLFDNDGQPFVLTHARLMQARLLVRDTSTGWGLQVQSWQRTAILTGEPALRACAVLLARVNRLGAPPTIINDATGLLDTAGDPQGLITRIARVMSGNGMPSPPLWAPGVRLAWEMATHDAGERDALAGELQALQTAWREAETIAAIADNLLLPDAVHEKVRMLRHRP